MNNILNKLSLYAKKNTDSFSGRIFLFLFNGGQIMLRSFNIYDIYQRNAVIFGNETALKEAGKSISFAELLKQTDALSAILTGRGIRKGDRIAILANNNRKFFILFGAAAALGAIVVPLNWRLSAEEIGYILKDSAPKILLADDNHTEKISAVSNEIQIFGLDSSCKTFPCIDDAGAAAQWKPATVANDDPFCLIYTAAVEGKPRGATLTHGNISVGNIQLAAKTGFSRNDAYLNMLPLFHITGLNLAMSVMHVGGKNVIIAKFDEKAAIQLTEKEKITVMGSFPPILSRLTAETEKNACDISSLRIVLGIDGPDNIRPFESKTNAKFWILYGQTETTGLVTFSPAMEKPGSAGTQGFLTKMKIVDENDREVPVGETGEITAQGPLIFQGYWHQEDVNQKTFRNGWHHTGDLGQLDAEGYLWFKGRKPEKELIKPGGENVYPAEVEEVILQHTDVKAVSVIGVPDTQFGEGIKAVCVLKPGKSLDAEELIQFVASRIARYKKPRYVEFVGELPRKPDGSVDRQKVKELYGKE